MIDHAEKPRNVGVLDKNASNVGTGLVGAPACGDVMKFQIEYDDKSGKITNAVFKVCVCALGHTSRLYQACSTDD